MEAVNDASRLIAKASAEIKKYLEENDIDNVGMLEDAIGMLDEAMEKLITKI